MVESFADSVHCLWLVRLCHTQAQTLARSGRILSSARRRQCSPQVSDSGQRQRILPLDRGRALACSRDEAGEISHGIYCVRYVRANQSHTRNLPPTLLSVFARPSFWLLRFSPAVLSILARPALGELCCAAAAAAATKTTTTTVPTQETWMEWATLRAIKSASTLQPSTSSAIRWAGLPPPGASTSCL